MNEFADASGAEIVLLIYKVITDTWVRWKARQITVKPCPLHMNNISHGNLLKGLI